MIRRGAVCIDGVLCDDPFADFDLSNRGFTVNGVEWPFLPLATVVLHKPLGYECSRQPKHHLSVLDLLPLPLRERGLQPIGRLDEDTTGLLLLTDDGQLNHRISSGKRKVPKVYLATLAEPLTEAQLAQLMDGVVLNDGPEPVRAVAAERLEDGRLRLTLTEGKYHQVKRMVAAVGNHVQALHRSQLGGLLLPDDLLPGQWRWLSTVDHEKLDNFP